MLQIDHVTKRFQDITAIRDLSLDIAPGQVFGLLGTNGAGKSTLLRMMAGIYKPDEGKVLLENTPVYENPSLKEQIFFIPDDDYYFGNATCLDMMGHYAQFYPQMDLQRLLDLTGKFGLDSRRKLKTFSKGMKKQFSLLTGLCSGAPWLFCDETFDGLDPVMRQNMKSLMAQEMCDRDFTPVITSHNLRELEDICDHVGILHKGGVILSRDLDDMKQDLHKVQLATQEDITDYLRTHLDLVSLDKRGSLYTIIVRGRYDIIMGAMELLHPLFCEALPLSLEEIFISETEVTGYDFKTLLL